MCYVLFFRLYLFRREAAVFFLPVKVSASHRPLAADSAGGGRTGPPTPTGRGQTLVVFVNRGHCFRCRLRIPSPVVPSPSSSSSSSRRRLRRRRRRRRRRPSPVAIVVVVIVIVVACRSAAHRAVAHRHRRRLRCRRPLRAAAKLPPKPY